MSLTHANKFLSTLAAAVACAAIGYSATAALASTATGTSGTGGTSPGQATQSKTSKPQIATWFGPGFYGQKTACGQTMTPVVVGVASRTLPCGTLVLVNYKGHKLTVPVIDRGPYANNGAVWDLTAGAADALTITETVRIKTKVVGQAANTPNLGAPVEEKPSAEAVAAGGTSAA
ncbi:MAG TPA: septal ring lytic transglycosylase RlpA family protein [Solirubrobacteraceae bacterium]|jgi:rare lipoprotein A (peptidoglycan hydrolase)|nr:septal ring lytic transglycosylase RlpA family protein [Solirubrobacteraceae bacterium]